MCIKVILELLHHQPLVFHCPRMNWSAKHTSLYTNLPGKSYFVLCLQCDIYTQGVSDAIYGDKRHQTRHLFGAKPFEQVPWCDIRPQWVTVSSVGTSISWWRHQMKTFSALLAIYEGNSPMTGEFPPQRPVMRSFDAFFDLRLNTPLNKQSWGWWFETPSRSLRRHCNDTRWWSTLITRVE